MCGCGWCQVDIKAPTGSDALLRAVDSGARNSAATLLSYGVRPEVGDGRALHTATSHNNLPMIELLLNREAENKVLDAAEAKAAKKKSKKKKKKGEVPPPPLVQMPNPTVRPTHPPGLPLPARLLAAAACMCFEFVC